MDSRALAGGVKTEALRESVVRTRSWRMFVVSSEGAHAADSAPIVLVHGHIVSGRYMMPLARALAHRHRILLPDLPGYGRSGKPRHAPDLPDLADALVELLDAEGIDRAALVGNSYGCQIIVEACLRHPERVRAAILQGPTADPRDRTFLGLTVRWLRNVALEPPTLGPVLARDVLDTGLRRGWETFANLRADRVEEKLPFVRAPTLVLRGEHDPIVPDAWAHEVARLVPGAEARTIRDAAHTINYTHPHEMALAIETFLETRA